MEHRRRLLRYSAVLALFLVLATLVACNGASPPATPTPDATPTAVAPTPTPTTPPGPSPTPTPLPPVQPTPTPTPEAASGVPTIVITVRMREHLYAFDPAPITGREKLVFRVVNEGQQDHELVLLRLEDTDQESVLGLLQGVQQTGSVPEGTAVIAQTGPVSPAAAVTLNVAEPLGPGRYFIASLLPDVHDPDDVLQALKGMVAEFVVVQES